MLFNQFVQEREAAIRRRSFIEIPWKKSAKKLIRSEAGRCNLQVYKKNSFTSSFMYFHLILSERITIISSDKTLKMCERTFFRNYKRNVALLVIYLFSYNSSTSTFFIAFGGFFMVTFFFVNF